MYSLYNLKQETYLDQSQLLSNLKSVKEKLGELMHHDTITGTSPSHVIDYNMQ